MTTKLVFLIKKYAKLILEKAWFAFHPYSKLYSISGTKNLNKNLAYSDKKTEPKFPELLEKFQVEVEEVVRNKKPFSFYKFGDGDFYFLKGIPLGSAKPGNRAMSKPLTDEDMNIFRANSALCNRYMCEIPQENRNLFKETFPGRKIDYPAEIVYGLIANKWLTSTFAEQIGVIGADAKVDLLQLLMTYPEYQEYLELKQFASYLKIPQKFACDNHLEVFTNLKNQILSSDCRVFLAGVGHVKSAILAPLAKETGSVILDIGSGIDALAGVISNHRPYFAKWINFQVTEEFDYSKIDYLQYRNSTIRAL
jgi:hypothetical protein